MFPIIQKGAIRKNSLLIFDLLLLLAFDYIKNVLNLSVELSLLVLKICVLRSNLGQE